MPLEDPR